MKKILLIHPALAPYREDYFNELSDISDLTVVFLCKNAIYNVFDQDSMRKNIKYKYEYLTTGMNIRGRVVRTGIIKLIKKHLPEIVIVSEYNINTLYLVMINRFITNNNIIYVMTDDNKSMVYDDSGWIKRRVKAVILKRVKGIIVLSEEVKNEYINKYKNIDNIYVHPLLHNDDIFRNKIAKAYNKSMQYYSEYKLQKKIVVLFVGRLVKEKNVLNMIKAMSLVIQKNNNIIMVFVGEGPEKTEIAKIAKNNNVCNNVIMIGKQYGDNLYAWYNIGDVLLLPSNYEPFGAVINEALISGIPVMMSVNVGAKELVSEYNQGTIVRHENIVDMANDIEVYIEKRIKPKNIVSIRCSLMKHNFKKPFDQSIYKESE